MKYLGLTAVIATTLLLGWVMIRSAQPHEPRYQGQTLTAWLRIYENGIQHGPGIKTIVSTRPDAEAAVRAIGTNGIPTLLRLIQAYDSVSQDKIVSMVNRQTWIHSSVLDQSQKRLLAGDGFRILGTNAVSAVPALVKLTTNKDIEIRGLALTSLSNLGPDDNARIMPLLLGLKDSDPNIRSSARIEFYTRYPDTFLSNLLESIAVPDPTDRFEAALALNIYFPNEADQAGVYKMFPQLKPPMEHNRQTHPPSPR